MQYGFKIAVTICVSMKHPILKIFLGTIIHICLIQGISAQNTFHAVAIDSITNEKLNGAAVLLKSSNNGAISDSAGLIEIKNIPNGEQTFEVSFVGYNPKTATLHFPLSSNTVFKINMAPQERLSEQVIITSTRMNSRIEDEPIKVEVLGAADLEEESSLKPGNVSSILGDVSGVQIQQTSAVSGNSVVRMQGMDGRYTMLLRDGMPSYGSLSGGISILQIPPLDLKQIEIIKGPASTINGGGAIAGLINFVSKEPGDSTEASFVLNQSTLTETNMDAYVSGKSNKIGYTLFVGGTHQFARDVNADGFSDVPKTLSFIVHPQLFFYPSNKTTVRIGFTGNYESRLGGDMNVIREEADSMHQYFEKNIIENYATDLQVKSQLKNNQSVSFKASADYLKRSFNTNYSELRAGQWSAYSELYYSITSRRDNFIIGADYQLDRFKRSPGDTSSFINHIYHTAGLFAQYNYVIPDRLNLQVGLRGDYQSKYGFFVLPSAALLVHANKEVSVRINWGSGYVVPDILDIAGQNDNITSYISSAKLLNEHSHGGTVEWNYKKLFSNKGVSLFINQSFFYTIVSHSVIDYYNSAGVDSIFNIKGTSTLGIDNYIRVSKGPVDIYLGYTFTYPRKSGFASEPWLTLTPMHRAAGVITAQISKHFKLGIEGSVIGREYLDDGSRTKPYFLLSSSLQYHINRVTLVLNGENLLDVRQTHFGPVVNPPYTHPTFAQIWAPVDGIVVNFSVMVKI